MAGQGYVEEPLSCPSSPAVWKEALSPQATPTHGGHDPLQTLTSGAKKEVKGGAVQAHICVISKQDDVAKVMEAFKSAASFSGVISWCYGYRLLVQRDRKIRLSDVKEEVEEGDQPQQVPQEVVLEESPVTMLEGAEDGLDEGCGEKILSILKRSSLQGLLLVISRWQDYGATPGLELFGTGIYAVVMERSKDLITNLKRAMGMDEEALALPAVPQEDLLPKHKHFDFSFLPKLPAPRVPTKYGPNHFLSETPLNRPVSLPSLWSGGDVRLWMANDQCLRHLPDAELVALRSLRQPDERVERVLHAVALLRGQVPTNLGGAPAARWGHLLQVLRSATLRTELMLFDANTVSVETAQQVLNMLEGFEGSEIRRANPGAGVLFEWAQGVARWRVSGPPGQQEVDGGAVQAPEMQTLRLKDADMSYLSPTPQRKALSRTPSSRKSLLRKKGMPMTSLERSRSAALLGMTMM
eukprot:TRINITY_DN7100_c2_g2_i1.p1 TRINITY_DN7100_c2_g2~~TRINITY_DN7100_c2_g2_i1.p1  ORF type:complete len:488 (-),score=76.10 TRINITY_DN7100_c2_g2_i1:89-1492(-)